MSMSIMTKSLACIAVLVLVLGEARRADADYATKVKFFTNRAEFRSWLLSSTTIDFEGIVGDTAYLAQGSSTKIDEVTFSTVHSGGEDGTLFVSGKNSVLSGTPYDSAIILSGAAAANPIRADLTTAGSGFTAVGGFFGDINSGDSDTTLTLRSPTGAVLDTQTVTGGDMGQGLTETFYGWIVRGKDMSIGSVTHDLDGSFEGIDNFVFGDGNPAAVPEPSSVVALLSMLAAGGMISFAARRRKKAA